MKAVVAGAMMAMAAGAASAQNWWSMGGTEILLECAVIVEMFEPEAGAALPEDFDAMAEEIRRTVSLRHGTRFVESVTAQKRAYWEAAELNAADRDRVAQLLKGCEPFLLAVAERLDR